MKKKLYFLLLMTTAILSQEVLPDTFIKNEPPKLTPEVAMNETLRKKWEKDFRDHGAKLWGADKRLVGDILSAIKKGQAASWEGKEVIFHTISATAVATFNEEANTWKGWQGQPAEAYKLYFALIDPNKGTEIDALSIPNHKNLRVTIAHVTNSINVANFVKQKIEYSFGYGVKGKLVRMAFRQKDGIDRLTMEIE